MKRQILALVALVAFGTTAVHAADTAKLMADVAKNASGALAMVKFTLSDETGAKQDVIGPAMCIDASGVLMTLAMDPRARAESIGKDIDVILPGVPTRTLKAELMGIDTETGLTFVRVISKEPVKWSVIQFAAKADLAIGQEVVSIGLMSPDTGYAPCAGQGYVAAILRVPNELAYVAGGRLTSLGSPVFNAEGRAIGLVGNQMFMTYQMMIPRQGNQGGGVTTVGLKPQQESAFFTPVEEFAQAIANPPSKGEIRRMPWMGFLALEPLTQSTMDSLKIAGPAVRVISLANDSPAQKGGMKEGDIIVEFNGQPLEAFPTPELTEKNLERQLGRVAPGQKATFGVLRDGVRTTVSVTSEPMPVGPTEAARYISNPLGFAVREKVALDRMVDKTATAKIDGLYVIGRASGSPADAGNLQDNDLITQVNGQDVKSLDAFKKVLEGALTSNPTKAVVLTVKRGEKTEQVSLMPRKEAVAPK